MSIFTQDNLNNVQDVIKKSNGQNNIQKELVAKDEGSELNDQSQRIQLLIEEIDLLPDTAAKDLMQDCVQEIISFYGHGLKRILDIISKGNNTAAKDIYNNLIEDSFITGLLLIHDLHPLDLKTRLYQALEKVKPYMDSHGGSVEIVSLENGIVKLKLSGSCKGCPSSASTLELGIKQAIEEICPDLLGLEVEGIAETTHSHNGNQKTDAGWRIIKGVDDLQNGRMKFFEIGNVPLLICKVNDQLYAYKNNCPACEMSFNTGTLDEYILSCTLGHKYDVQHAGKCTDDEDIHVGPLPLIREDGVVKIAM